MPHFYRFSLGLGPFLGRILNDEIRDNSESLPDYEMSRFIVGALFRAEAHPFPPISNIHVGLFLDLCRGLVNKTYTDYYYDQKNDAGFPASMKFGVRVLFGARSRRD